MKTVNRRFKLSIIITMLLFVIFTNTVAFAGSIPTQGGTEYRLENADGYDTDEFINSMTDYSAVFYPVNNIGAISSSGTGSVATAIKMDRSQFAVLSPSEQKRCIEILANTKLYSKVSENQKNDLVGEIAELSGNASALIEILFSGTKPNWGAAMKIAAPFQSPVGTLIAAAVIILTSMLIVVIVLDLTYLTIPFVRNKRDDKEATINWVSREALAVSRESEESDYGKRQILWAYLKVRSIMMFVFVLCIMYLADGSIFKIIGWVIDRLQGFM